MGNSGRMSPNMTNPAWGLVGAASGGGHTPFATRKMVARDCEAKQIGYGIEQQRDEQLTS